ncbi:MAG: PQQ-binding-like beta-propeller repeat protein, partial [Planctomycetia bacterium]
HLVCVDRAAGVVRWTKTIPAELPEDQYQGYISEHGYASNTPAVDAERVYCFFGKGGVLAFDLDGKQLWKTDVGKESSNRRWGSGASLILNGDMVVVNASGESQSIRALDKKTGKEIWKASAQALELAYGTPGVAATKDGRRELVVAVPSEAWGLNLDTGKLNWYAQHELTGNVCPSVVVDGETLYVFGGFRSAGSLALRAGGQGDVTKSNVLWTARHSSCVATPVLYDGRLYWISDNGQAYCIAAKTGEQVYRERVAEIKGGGRPVYASPVVVGGNLYVPTRWSGVLVLPATARYEILAQNKFADDESDFNATPAVADDELFLRSDRRLYCVAKKTP